MKQNIFYLIAAMVLIAGCRKKDESQIPNGIKTSSVLPLITKDAGGPVSISAVDPSAFTGKFTVDLYFPNGEQPQKFDIVVIKNDDKSLVKTIQADVTSFPAAVTVTGTQLESLFGEPIVLGDNFEIGADITLASGDFYEAFPLFGEAYGTNVSQQQNASPTIAYGALCTFDAAQFAGDFEVVQDDAGLFAPGDVVPVTRIDDAHIAFEYPVVDARPVVITVDPTNGATVDKQVIGNFDDGYGDVSAEATGGADDFVAPCDGIISLNIEYTVAAGSYGSYLLKLKKKA